MALVFPTVNRLRTALLYGRAGRLAAKNGGFWPGQGTPRSTYAAAVEQVVVAVGDGSRPRRGMKYARANRLEALRRKKRALHTYVQVMDMPPTLSHTLEEIL